MRTPDQASATARPGLPPDARGTLEQDGSSGDRAADRILRDERRPVWTALAGALCALVPTAAVATAVAGRSGALGAFVGTALVLILFGAGAAMMMWAGRRGPSTITMVAALGVGARLMLYAAVLTALDGTDLVHPPSLAIATAVTLVITLAGECAVLARTPSLFRVDVPRTAPTARPRHHREANRSTTQ